MVEPLQRRRHHHFDERPGPSPTPAQPLNISTRLGVGTGDNVMIGGFIIKGTAPNRSSFAASDRRSLISALPASSSIPFSNCADLMAHCFSKTTIGKSATLPDRRYRLPACATIANQSSRLPRARRLYRHPYRQKSDRRHRPYRDLRHRPVPRFAIGEHEHARLRRCGGQSHDWWLHSWREWQHQNRHSRPWPILDQFGLTNVLPDPTLELHNANGATLVTNDNWTDDSASAALLRDNGLALSNQNESAIFTSLPPGQFTAVLAGKNGATGIGTIEIYNLR